MSTPDDVGFNVEIDNVEVAYTKCDLIGNLPIEIVQKILFQLTPEDLRSAVSCCQRWKTRISSDDYFWKKLCQREDYCEVSESKRSEFYTNFLKSYDNYWEGVYWYNDTVQRNWETNNYKQSCYSIKHPDYDYMNCFFLDDIFCILNLYRSELYAYNWKNTEPINCSASDDDSFHSSDLYKSENYLIDFVPELKLGVWDLDDGRMLYFNLLDHATDIHFDKNLIVLETANKKFEVFDIETSEIEYESIGIFKNLDIMDGRIVFITMDQAIHVLKWDDKSSVTLTCFDKMEVQKLIIDNNHLLGLCKNKDSMEISLCIWNIVTKTKLNSILLGCSYNLDRSFLIKKYLYLYKGNEIRSIFDYNSLYSLELWDYAKGTLAISASNLNTTNRVANNRFIFASRSSKIGMLCLRTGNFIDDLHIPIVYFALNGKLEATDTKLLYVKRRNRYVVFYVRDFEI